MKQYYLWFKLLSDAAFGRGDGIAGYVDNEVQHDDLGCPYLGGRALKGLLVAECADILAALLPAQQDRWSTCAHRLFGSPGAGLDGEAILSVGDARLPADLRARIEDDVRLDRLGREEVLDLFTDLRRQTAMDVSGVPKPHSLRTTRVILRETPFLAPLDLRVDPTANDLALLAACVKALRAAGGGTNRGRGRLCAELYDEQKQSVTKPCFDVFRREVLQ